MRKTPCLHLLLMGLFSSALAQTGSPQIVTERAACENGRFETRRIADDLAFEWIQPASFPNKAKSVSVHGDWILDCPTYSIKGSPRQAVVTSKTNIAVDALTPLKRGITLFSWGRYKYPELELEFLVDLFSIYFDPRTNKLSLDGETPRQLTIGYRVNNQALQPVVFESKIRKSTIDMDKKLELYTKIDLDLGDVNFAYISFDPAKKMLTIEKDHPFPDK